MSRKNNPSGKIDLVISSDQSLLNMQLIIDFICQTYWGKDLQPEQIRKSIENSLCFGLYANQNQIGFARVITDYTFFAWLADVFILPSHHREGYGEFLMNNILNYEQLKEIKRWRLATRDAHEFYAKFGFFKTQHPDRLMKRSNPS